MVESLGIYGAIPYETLDVVLPTGEVRAVSKTIGYLTVLSATFAADILVSFNGASFFNLPPGIAISDFKVDEIWLKNQNAATNTVRIACGLATLKDNRIVFDTLNPLPVTITGNPANNISQVAGVAVAANNGIGTAGTLRVAVASDSALNLATLGGTAVVNGGIAGVLSVGGPNGHSAVFTGNPVVIGAKVQTAIDSSLAAGDASALFCSDSGALITKPFALPQLDWSYPAATGGILNSTVGVVAKATAGAGVRNYITSLQIQAEALGAATEFVVNDGAAGTVLFRFKIGVGGLPLTNIEFVSPLRGSQNTLVEIKTLTASVTGAVYGNLQGFQAL